MVEGELMWKGSALSRFSEGHFMAVQTTHQFSPPIPSVSLSRGAESFPHCALSRDQQPSKIQYIHYKSELWGNSVSRWSSMLAVAALANVSREHMAACGAEDWGLRSASQMLTPSVKPEVHGAMEGSRETGGKEPSADKLWVFSSNACQHLKALVGLLSSPGTCERPRALLLNAEQFGRKHSEVAGETRSGLKLNRNFVANRSKCLIRSVLLKQHRGRDPWRSM